MRNKSVLIISLLLSFSIIVLAGCDKEKVITPSDLPSEILRFCSTHFPDNAIIHSVKERDDFKVSYKIILEGNVKLKFNAKKEIYEIESLTKLPDSVVPEKIRQYVTTNYPENYIIEWEIDDGIQEVKLNNGLELEFTMKGEFIRIDN